MSPDFVICPLGGKIENPRLRTTGLDFGGLEFASCFSTLCISNPQPFH